MFRNLLARIWSPRASSSPGPDRGMWLFYLVFLILAIIRIQMIKLSQACSSVVPDICLHPDLRGLRNGLASYPEVAGCGLGSSDSRREPIRGIHRRVGSSTPGSRGLQATAAGATDAVLRPSCGWFALSILDSRLNASRQSFRLEHGAAFRLRLSREREARLLRSGRQNLRGRVFAHSRSVLEPVARAAADEPDVAVIGVAIDQEIAA